MIDKINYVELGTHNGDTIAEMVVLFNNLNINYRIAGVEAHPDWAKYCRQRFNQDFRVTIFNYAIAPREGIVHLYLTNEKTDHDLDGASIYKSKRNVDPKMSILVQGFPFVQLYQELLRTSLHMGTTTILSANIEGAEYDLVYDLEKHCAWNEFNECLSASGSWTTDMKKCALISASVAEVEETLHNAGVKIITHKRFAELLMGGAYGS